MTNKCVSFRLNVCNCVLIRNIYSYIFNNNFYDDFNIVPYTCIGTVYIEVVTAIQTISFKKNLLQQMHGYVENNIIL